MTWSKPEPLRYDDGTTVWPPRVCIPLHHVDENRQDVFAHEHAALACVRTDARYPLTIAEFDTDTCRVRRDTVQTVQDKPAGAPLDRRYTKFGLYEERNTGDLILAMPEMPRHKNDEDLQPDDFSSDCIRFRVTLPGGPRSRNDRQTDVQSCCYGV